MKTEEFERFKEQYAKEPVIFFFDVIKIFRDDIENGLTRQECIDMSHTAIPLSTFDTDWNDTDAGTDADNKPRTYIPDVMHNWCYVSMPE